ncbi:histamine N-methyltransferase-like [Exaiptasia diaphana]|uniref:Histamine N-methyltransferase n=1 Tax=Exaiptasia diaphana TaxID=2652724 RepID=A0A913XU78_EXADI|nr:histamine N-methyltransferase-like [Exaiptasia diaphana]
MELLSFQTGKYYSSCFSVFKQNIVGDYSVVLLNLPTIIRSMLEDAKELSQFNILSIGSGDGTEDIKVAKIVEEELQRIEEYRDVKIFLRGIEPNEYFKSLYDKAIEELTGSLKTRSVFDFRGNTFEEYMDQNDDLRFDLVVFTHSMYYLDEEKSLKYCFDRVLREDGKIAVTVEERGPLSSVNFDVDECDIAKLQCYEKVTKAVEKNKWSSSVFIDAYKIDVTEIFDEKSQDGNLLLDFLMQKVDFRGKAKKKHVNHVMEVLEENTLLKNEKRVAVVFDSMIVISKTN